MYIMKHVHFCFALCFNNITLSEDETQTHKHNDPVNVTACILQQIVDCKTNISLHRTSLLLSNVITRQ